MAQNLKFVWQSIPNKRHFPGFGEPSSPCSYIRICSNIRIFCKFRQNLDKMGMLVFEHLRYIIVTHLNFEKLKAFQSDESASSRSKRWSKIPETGICISHFTWTNKQPGDRKDILLISECNAKSPQMTVSRTASGKWAVWIKAPSSAPPVGRRLVGHYVLCTPSNARPNLASISLNQHPMPGNTNEALRKGTLRFHFARSDKSHFKYRLKAAFLCKIERPRDSTLVSCGNVALFADFDEQDGSSTSIPHFFGNAAFLFSAPQTSNHQNTSHIFHTLLREPDSLSGRRLLLGGAGRSIFRLQNAAICAGQALSHLLDGRASSGKGCQRRLRHVQHSGHRLSHLSVLFNF